MKSGLRARIASTWNSWQFDFNWKPRTLIEIALVAAGIGLAIAFPKQWWLLLVFIAALVVLVLTSPGSSGGGG